MVYRVSRFFISEKVAKYLMTWETISDWPVGKHRGNWNFVQKLTAKLSISYIDQFYREFERAETCLYFSTKDWIFLNHPIASILSLFIINSWRNAESSSPIPLAFRNSFRPSRKPLFKSLKLKAQRSIKKLRSKNKKLQLNNEHT